ncbi:ATP-binding protein [uncultured Chryseobacterium sp.]|uniref:AAA family ATPase n=1 Tax=uncultured Chryseobacterium sp. TaxID=259322 RepID=UPI0025910F72|nr:ATP-binding protein [uncultured Chryseobacterium sp.]
MIINFSVENFGSIKEKQTLSFLANKSDHLEDYYIIEPIKGLRLNKLALIYGANASGKTTILKALDFLKKICTEPFNKRTEKFDFEPFLFDEHTPKQNTKLELEFVKNQVRYFYEVELNKNCIVCEKLYNFNPNKGLVFERTTDESKELTSIKFGSKISKKKSLKDNLEIFTLWNNTVFGGFLKSNVETFEPFEALVRSLPDFNDEHKSLERYVSNMIGDSYINKRFIIEILKKADFNIVDINVEIEKIPYSDNDIDFMSRFYTDEGKSLLYNLKEKDSLNYTEVKTEFIHKAKNNYFRIPIKFESEGTRKYYGISSILNDLIFFNNVKSIDELESSLHPDLFNHFLLTYLVNGKRESQLISTTHNREILNNRDIFRNDAIWFTDKNEDSATELYSLADFDSSVVRDTTNVLNTYKSGKLGGVPNLGDYYIDLDNE